MFPTTIWTTAICLFLVQVGTQICYAAPATGSDPVIAVNTDGTNTAGATINDAAVQALGKGTNLIANQVIEAINGVANVIDTLQRYSNSTSAYLHRLSLLTQSLGDKLLESGSNGTSTVLNRLSARIARSTDNQNRYNLGYSPAASTSGNVDFRRYLPNLNNFGLNAASRTTPELNTLTRVPDSTSGFGNWMSGALGTQISLDSNAANRVADLANGRLRAGIDQSAATANGIAELANDTLGTGTVQASEIGSGVMEAITNAAEGSLQLPQVTNTLQDL